jgi:hypothetical protein
MEFYNPASPVGLGFAGKSRNAKLTNVFMSLL